MMNIYHRQDDGKLGCVQVSDTTDEGVAVGHGEAILEVCEFLVESGEGYNQPVLAVIKGGKNDK